MALKAQRVQGYACWLVNRIAVFSSEKDTLGLGLGFSGQWYELFVSGFNNSNSPTRGGNLRTKRGVEENFDT